MKRPGAIAIAVLGALLVALLLFGVLRQGNDRTLDDAVVRGERPAAPDARLPLLNGGGRRSLADYRGRVVVLNFWASWCVPCREEAPLLERVHRRLGSRGTVLGVTYKDYAGDSRRFMRELRLTYPSLRDDKLELAPKYGTNALPETFVLDREGGIVALSRGQVTAKFLDKYVAKALAS